MLKLRCAAFAAVLIGSVAHAQTGDFATANMHFDAKDMDTSGDHMITREEMQKYAEHMWEEMAHGRKAVPLGAAAKDFASAGLNFQAREIDTDGDGTISRAEFLAYTGKKFDAMKNTGGMVPVDDVAAAFARGNMPAAH